MTRTYKLDAPATFAEGEPLDAWTARTRIQTNGEAVYEEARDDGRIILQAYQEVTIATPFGPIPIRITMDRSGLWRTQYIDLCFSAGGHDKIQTWAVLTDTYRRPTTDSIVVRIPDGSDPYCEWTPDSGSVPAWLGAQAITLPRDWSPSIVERGDGVARGTMRIAWLSVWVMETASGDNPRLAGIRHYESVADEP